MTESLRAGANQVYGINFRVAEPAKYKEEARLKAIRAARDKATTMAAELGQKLGKPSTVVEEADSDVRSFSQFGTNTQNIYERVTAAPFQTEEPTIAGGTVTIHASIRITFQLE